MPTKTIQTFNILPIEIDKVYVTKFATGEKFTVKQIILNKKTQIPMYVVGIYENSPNIGLCTLPIERLIHERCIDGEDVVCSICNTPINL